MKYYSANGLLGRGALFNQVYSDRSDGKTFDIKYRGLQRFIKHGYTTVYVRRWKTEFTAAMEQTFLNEVLAVYPALNIYDIRGSKNGIECKRKGTKDPWRFMFYFVAISVANKLKSNFDITNIREIDFDEYVPLDNRYAQDEMILLLELYRTCDRDRNVVKLCTFGNRITGTTPFLTFFNINADITVPKIHTYKNNTIAIQIYKNDEHRETVKQSPIAQMVDGTPYADYMTGGILLNGSAVISPKPSDAIIWAAFRSVAGSGSIWQLNKLLYISDRQVDASATITDKPYGGDHEYLITLGTLSTYIKQAYRTGCLRATSDRAWELFKPIMKIASIH